MKPNISTHPARIWALLAIIGMLEPPLSLVSGAEKSEPTEAKELVYDLEISNGMLVVDGKKTEAVLANVVDALRARYQDANIVIAPGLGQLKIGDLKLRARQLLDELEAVRVASGGRFDVRPTIDPTTGLPVSGAMNSGLFVLQLPTTPQNERVVEAFNIEPYLMTLRRDQVLVEPAPEREKRERESIDELTRIVAETIETLKSDSRSTEQPVFRFHRGSSMLVVIGPRESVDVARKIVNALPGMGSHLDLVLPTPPRAESAEANAAQEAFRKRYGLGPKPQDNAGTPAPSTTQK